MLLDGLISQLYTGDPKSAVQGLQQVCKCSVMTSHRYQKSQVDSEWAALCSKVVEAMREHANEKEVQLWALKAARALIEHQPVNRIRLVESGACKALAECMQTFRRDRAVLLACLVAINEALDYNVELLGTEGMCALVFQAVEDFPKDAEVLSAACAVVRRMAQDPKNRQEFLRRLTEPVADVLREMKDEVSEIYWAASALAPGSDWARHFQHEPRPRSFPRDGASEVAAALKSAPTSNSASNSASSGSNNAPANDGKTPKPTDPLLVPPSGLRYTDLNGLAEAFVKEHKKPSCLKCGSGRLAPHTLSTAKCVGSKRRGVKSCGTVVCFICSHALGGGKGAERAHLTGAHPTHAITKGDDPAKYFTHFCHSNAMERMLNTVPDAEQRNRLLVLASEHKNADASLRAYAGGAGFEGGKRCIIS